MDSKQIRLFNIYPTAEGSYFIVLEDIETLEKFGILTFQSEAAYILSFYFEKPIPRPSIYNVFSQYLDQTGAHIKEVVISQFKNCIYYAELICQTDENEVTSFDIRATDAIALAYLNHAPIFANISVITECSQKYGSIITRLQEKFQENNNLIGTKASTVLREKANQEKSYEEQLQQAINEEDYELAAKLKKEHDKKVEGEQS